MTAPLHPGLDLARASYRAMDLYAPNRKPCAIDLSDNTNLAGLPPSAKSALEEASSSAFTRYPSIYAADLKRAIADFVGVAPENVVTGCGSDDVIDSAIRAFTEPGDRIAYPEPTFAMLPTFAAMNSLETRAIDLRDDLEIDAEALVRASAKITYVCTPNNPTGTLASSAALDVVIQRSPGLVIVDEAYIDYAEIEGLSQKAPSHPRLLVVRTLSKAFGLAGMRIGYAVGSPELCSAVEKSRGPYKVTGLAERMAVAALDHDRDWVRERVTEVLESRTRFVAWLESRGVSSVVSAANFVFVPQSDALAKAALLREKGVAVRPFPGSIRALGSAPGDTERGDALRISVGPWSIMERALDAFSEVLA